MGNEVLDRIDERAEELAAEGLVNEKLGRLSDAAAAILRETGAIKMLQPKTHGGLEGLAHAIHVPGSVFHASALTQLGIEPPPGPMLSMI